MSELPSSTAWSSFLAKKGATSATGLGSRVETSLRIHEVEKIRQVMLLIGPFGGSGGAECNAIAQYVLPGCMFKLRFSDPKLLNIYIVVYTSWTEHSTKQGLRHPQTTTNDLNLQSQRRTAQESVQRIFGKWVPFRKFATLLPEDPTGSQASSWNPNPQSS